MTRTLVHFFPLGMNVTAPYPVVVEVSVMGAGQSKRSVVIEGARLGQPDGIRLDELFGFFADDKSAPQTLSTLSPVNNNAPRLLALEVKMSIPAHRISLLPSSCVIEIQSNAHSVRFFPVSMEKTSTALGRQAPQNPQRLVPLVKDSSWLTSVMTVNTSSRPWKPALFSRQVSEAGDRSDRALALGDMGGESVIERSADNGTFAADPHQMGVHELSLGLSRTSSLYLGGAREAGTAAYMMLRDATSKKLLSIVGF